MNEGLKPCPGDSLESFVRAIANDLRHRRLEYLLVAYFGSENSPVAMRKIAGRTTWVSHPISQVIAEARELGAAGVALIHNHPAKREQPANLQPSAGDVSYVQQLLDELRQHDIAYHGCWITSKGQVNEVLHHVLRRTAQHAGESPPIGDQALSYAFSPVLMATTKTLTKAPVFVLDWHNVGSIGSNPDDGTDNVHLLLHGTSFKVQARRVYPLGEPENAVSQILLTAKALEGEGITDMISDDPTCTDIDSSFLEKEATKSEVTTLLSVEEASRAFAGLAELAAHAEATEDQKREYTEVRLQISDDCQCGFYHQDSEQSGFLTVRGEHFSIGSYEFTKLAELLGQALEHLEEALGGAGE